STKRTTARRTDSFLATRQARATASRSSGPPRKTAATWVVTFSSPWFPAASVLVDILVGSWKLVPHLRNGRSARMAVVSWSGSAMCSSVWWLRSYASFSFRNTTANTGPAMM
uniref:Uncharacterized protein n=1 Tax=Setaria italica TaxID=4555 RepID=K4A2M3_SETIT